MRMAHESGAGDEDYVQRAVIHYQSETALPLKFCHCWDVLKDSPKWKEIAHPNFYTWSEGGSKRHKSSGSSSVNAESGDTSINLNTNVGDEYKMTAAEVQQREALIEINRREVKCHEREVAAMEYRQQQENIRFYLQPYDHLTGDQLMAMDKAREKIKAKYNLQY
nr:hypothetical protein [Tanacetum cinerariifolium]